uniref:TGF_BETA_2 domain-containing protein n=1 Tax=Meloidogyne hapla TaxID=6305 RepID=A0A1I8BQT7_MELHA
MSAFTEVRSVQTTLMRGDLRDLKHKDNNVTMNDAAIQTDRLRLSFKKLQIRSRRNDAQTMTFTSLGQNIMNAKSQTDKKLLTEDQGIQTWIPFELVDLYEKDTQTYRFMKSQRIQTPKPVNNDAQTQSHNTDLNGQIYPSVSVLKMFLNPIDIDHNNDIVSKFLLHRCRCPISHECVFVEHDLRHKVYKFTCMRIVEQQKYPYAYGQSNRSRNRLIVRSRHGRRRSVK